MKFEMSHSRKDESLISNGIINISGDKFVYQGKSA